MVCESCGVKKHGFLFKCSRCGMMCCVDCRIPELHSCPAITWTITATYIKHDLNKFYMPQDQRK